MNMKTSAAVGLAATLIGVGGVAPAFAQDRNNAEMKETLMGIFDMSNAIIDVDALLAPGVPKDGIPSITDPEKVAASSADFPTMTGRVVSVTINGEAAAYPIQILNWHEAVNDTVGGVPIVVTYCPLCDSASVADRRITTKDGETLTLEFGISGFLYNSNMVMYDQTSMGIWSQVYNRAMTGPLAGTRLTTLPFRVESFAKFIASNPTGKVQTTNTGHNRAYDRNPYQNYFENAESVYHEFGWRDELPLKALGAGIMAGDEAIFVTVKAMEEAGGTMTVETALGEVTVVRTEAGVAFENVADGIEVMQTFWHSWSAFHPQTTYRAGAGEAKSE